MDRANVKDMVYVALEDLLTKHNNFWSGLGEPMLTERGQQAVQDLILALGPAIVRAHVEHMDSLSKNLVLKQLGDSKQ